ncbi:MAG: hypothetical protein AAF564_09860 [Bacteroidota bacterium]
MSDQVCTSREHQIVDALFGDLDATGLADLQQHMDSCSGCAGAFQEMQQTLDVTAQVPVPDVPADYWSGYYERLEARMYAGQRVARPFAHLGAAWQQVRLRLAPYFSPRPAYMQWGTALALVLLGVFIGRQWQDNPTAVPLAPAPAQTDPLLQPAQLSEKTHQYLDRSKVLLLGLVNFDVDEDDPAFINLEHKQILANELVQEAALLKNELSENREQQLSALVEELELILLQIANLELQQDVPSIELIQRGVDRGALLLKINLEKMKLSEREAPAPAKTADEEQAAGFLML